MQLSERVEGIGTRIKELRTRAELTQPELARGTTSVSHISLIESGKRQPSREIVQKIADRLGVTLEFLVDGPNSIATQNRRKEFLFAEMALANGDIEFAECSIRTLIEGSELIETPDFMWRLFRLHARTLEGLGRIDLARITLKRAIALAEMSGSPLEKIEMAIDLSRFARDVGDYVLALEIITEAQQTVPAQLQQSSTYARLLSSAIAIHFLRGDYIRAGHLSDAALEIFDEGTDPIARASILWNASLAADANNDTVSALLLAQRAAGLFSETDDRREEGRLRIAIAWLLTRQTPPDAPAARIQLERAMELLADLGTALDHAGLLIESSRVEWLDNNFDRALSDANSSLEALQGSGASLKIAEAFLLAARAQISLGRAVESTMNLEAARMSLAEMEPSRQNALAWRELGDIYAGLNYLPEAIAAYREALHDAGVPSSPIAFSEAQKVQDEAELIFRKH
jgi:transcriptional regulator with XRE-family HTH domain